VHEQVPGAEQQAGPREAVGGVQQPSGDEVAGVLGQFVLSEGVGEALISARVTSLHQIPSGRMVGYLVTGGPWTPEMPPSCSKLILSRSAARVVYRSAISMRLVSAIFAGG
jgi:hypothetical protein